MHAVAHPMPADRYDATTAQLVSAGAWVVAVTGTLVAALLLLDEPIAWSHVLLNLSAGAMGALAVVLGDELYAITSGGGVIRTPVNGVRHNKDRATMGVKLMNLPEDVSIVAIARTTDNDEPSA